MSSQEDEPEVEKNPLYHGPLHLLKPSADRSRLTLDPDAFAALKSITGPIALVSIVGKSQLFFSQIDIHFQRNTKGRKKYSDEPTAFP